MTVARVWTAAVDETRGDEYEQFAREISLPMFQKQEGYEGALMLRSGADCMVLTLWSDERRAQQLRSSLYYAETVKQMRDRGFLVGEQSLKVFAMHLMDLTQKHPE